jgi:hypothetical protein
MDIILRPVFYLKLNISEINFSVLSLKDVLN